MEAQWRAESALSGQPGNGARLQRAYEIIGRIGDQLVREAWIGLLEARGPEVVLSTIEEYPSEVQERHEKALADFVGRLGGAEKGVWDNELYRRALNRNKYCYDVPVLPTWQPIPSPVCMLFRRLFRPRGGRSGRRRSARSSAKNSDAGGGEPPPFGAKRPERKGDDANQTLSLILACSTILSYNSVLYAQGLQPHYQDAQGCARGVECGGAVGISVGRTVLPEDIGRGVGAEGASQEGGCSRSPDSRAARGRDCQ